mmetsp:Transcript_33893/g.93728  ORF Transcript_33893/g.93728 Transcript_33893/m.93728 type:complete len:225 (-) Transcript_33893:555-1229(-)
MQTLVGSYCSVDGLKNHLQTPLVQWDVRRVPEQALPMWWLQEQGCVAMQDELISRSMQPRHVTLVELPRSKFQPLMVVETTCCLRCKVAPFPIAVHLPRLPCFRRWEGHRPGCLQVVHLPLRKAYRSEGTAKCELFHIDIPRLPESLRQDAVLNPAGQHLPQVINVDDPWRSRGVVVDDLLEAQIAMWAHSLLPRMPRIFQWPLLGERQALVHQRFPHMIHEGV